MIVYKTIQRFIHSLLKVFFTMAILITATMQDG